jgi:hypothetical protein
LHLPILLLLHISLCDVLNLVASFSIIPSSSKKVFIVSSIAYSSLDVLLVLYFGGFSPLLVWIFIAYHLLGFLVFIR